MRTLLVVIAIAGCKNEPAIQIDVGPAVDKLAAEFERAEARAEAREAAERARPRRSHSNVPPDAARTIERARAAIAARDFRALETLLDDYDGIGSFELTRDLTATTARAAIDGWRKNPAILQRIDDALAADCEVDPPDEGHILVSCGPDRSGAMSVILSNLVDGEHERVFKIYSVGTSR